MPKVCATVNLLDENRQRVTLYKGDEVPEWALARITNPAALAAEDKAPEAVAPITPAVPANPVIEKGVEAIDYSKLSKDALIALCKERELDTKGNKPELMARLEDADKAAPSAAVEEVDLFALTVDELKMIAAERNIDLGGATTDVEIATVIQQAGG